MYEHIDKLKIARNSKNANFLTIYFPYRISVSVLAVNCDPTEEKIMERVESYIRSPQKKKIKCLSESEFHNIRVLLPVAKMHR